MRIISIRHCKSRNNELMEEDYRKYLKERSSDPDIGKGEEERCKRLGKFLKENNIRIDKFYSSLHLRTLKTMTNIVKEYNEKIPKEAFLEIHEVGGIYLEKKGFPGLNLEEIKKNFPDIIIPNDIDISKGWYLCEHKETFEEAKNRTKNVINKLKEMAVNCEDDNYTICLITHEDFSNGFYSLLNGTDYMNSNLNFGNENLALSSFTIDKKKNVKIDFLNFNCFK